MSLADLAARYGVAASRRIWNASSDAARDLIHTISRHGIECGLVERPSVYYTTRLEKVESLQQELDRRRGAGIRGQWLSPGRVRALTGMTAAGAILTQGNAQFDPYRAGIGLLRAAAAAGVQIHNGMTFAALAARVLREQWQGLKTPDHELFAFGRG